MKELNGNGSIWQKIEYVGRISLAGTTGEDADDACLVVSDDGPRIPRGRESAVLVAARVNGNLHGHPAIAPVIAVFPDEGFDGATATDGESGGVAVRVEHGWVA